MALAPVDFVAMQQLARGWTSQHPDVNIMKLPRTRRLVDRGARAAFAMHTKPVFDENSEIKPAPCDLCGMWSKAFCEACDTSAQAPTGLCSICDRDHLVCWKCVNNNRSWEVAVAERASVHAGEHEAIGFFGLARQVRAVTNSVTTCSYRRASENFIFFEFCQTESYRICSLLDFKTPPFCAPRHRTPGSLLKR